MNLLIIITISLAIAINIIVWLLEIKHFRFFTVVLDIGLTTFIVSLAGGGAYIMASSLFASLIVSAFLNYAKRTTRSGTRVRLIPDFDIIVRKFANKNQRRV
jgi:hypothetical protein